MSLKIYCTTDTHGKLLNDKGYSTLPKYILSDLENRVFIDNGDLLVGDIKTTYFNNVLTKNNKDSCVLYDVLNDYKCDVAILGNHDIDYGIDFLRERVKHFNGHYLCANLYDIDEKLVFDSHVILERSGYKIGIIGAVTGYLQRVTEYKNTKDLIVKNPVEEISKIVLEIKNKCDLIIVSYHGGTYKDLQFENVTYYNTGEDQSYEILNIEGIDVLIYGHQHFIDMGKSNGKNFVQSSCNMKYIGEVEYSKVDGKLISTVKNNINPIAYSNDDQLNRELKYFEKLCKFRNVDYNPYFSPEYNMDKIYFDVNKYKKWLNLVVDYSKMSEFIYTNFECDGYLITLKGDKIIDFYKSFSFPYQLSLYELSKKEFENIKLNLNLNENILLDYNVNNNRDSILLISNDKRLPYYRIKEDYVYNIFDMYIKFLNSD